MKVSFVSILTTAALFISTVQCTSYSLWSAERRSGRVKCIPYTQEQRESVMGNVDRMMKMWVNSDSKQIHYKGKANPYPDLDTFRKTYAGMNDEQFSLGLARIFNKMRDKHTLFHKAGPYGCFSVTTGLFFNFVDDLVGSSEPPKVRVVGITDAPETLDLIWNVLSTVAIGDELLTVNGLSFDDWYEQNKFILGFGANDSGGHSGAFKYLAEIMGDSNILPEDDSITFQLRRLGGNQELYTVTVPYVALSNDECWDLSSSLYKELTSITLPEMPAPTSFIQKRYLLVDQLQYTESILLDIRGNSGGSISAADGIIQLFKSDVTASTFRYLKNDATESLFYKGLNSNNPWSKAWSATSDTSRYSGFGSMSDSSILNTFGQSYCQCSSTGSSGDYAGELVEDNGVKSDVIVRPTIDDILPGDTGISAYDRIANYLGDVAKRQVDSKVYFISEPYNRATFDDLIYIPFVASGVDEIIVVHQVFKTHRQITRMPTSNDRVSMNTAKSYTVAGPSSGVGVYNFGSTLEQEGWNFNDGKWILGDGVSDYSGYMSSTIRVWLSAPVGSTISVLLDGIVDTHENDGYFSLVVIDDSGEIVPMVSSANDDGSTPYQSVTGRSRVIDETYSFTVTTENFALGLDFVSYSTESPFSVKLNSIVITKD
ncbi:hypothetical protein BASA60_004373 [Batrachochytrium salamandrivorans]|nr:hypothetical protein BASA60_004373 [Batrachochytrium salamandrivorans]